MQFEVTVPEGSTDTETMAFVLAEGVSDVSRDHSSLLPFLVVEPEGKEAGQEIQVAVLHVGEAWIENGYILAGLNAGSIPLIIPVSLALACGCARNERKQATRSSNQQWR